MEYLGGSTIAGDKLKEAGDAHWNVPNTDASNSSLFTALPGGYRSLENGAFNGAVSWGGWYTSTEMTSTTIWHRVMYNSEHKIDRGPVVKTPGLSIRCVKD